MKKQASPPAISTFPLCRRVAVCAVRAVLIFPVGRNPEDTTVILAIAFLLGSWTLVATTWNNPVVFGAVYWPLAVMAPPAAPSCTLQMTFPFKEVFTLTLKARTPSGPNTSDGGEADTTSVATVTVAVCFWGGSALLVAITGKTPS